jgi:hypothetical protein
MLCSKVNQDIEASRIDKEIEMLTLIIEKYLKNIDDINDDKELEMLNESILYIETIPEINDKDVNIKDWHMINKKAK